MRKAPRKEKKWAVKASPGPHASEEAVPLSVALRENLNIAETRREAKKILGQGEVEVDGKVRKNPNYPVGLMDVVKIPKTGQVWRVLYNRKGYLLFKEVDEEDSDFKLVKVVGKHPYKDEKLQISLHDGKTLIGDFESIDIGDTLKLSLPELEVEEHIPCVEGNIALVTGGTNVGREGKVKEILEIEGPSPNRFDIESDDEEFQSPEQYVFIIGGEESLITLLEGG